jgi:hypothetical protein
MIAARELAGMLCHWQASRPPCLSSSNACNALAAVPGQLEYRWSTIPGSGLCSCPHILLPQIILRATISFHAALNLIMLWRIIGLCVKKYCAFD